MGALVTSSQLVLGLLPLVLTACVMRPPAQGGPQTQAGVAGAPTASTAPAGPPLSSDPKDTMIFLLLGQSNMAGAPSPEAEDEVEEPRVKVLAYEDCSRLGRRYNQWYTAKPPLHGCGGGLGPGDYFGRAIAKAFPNATIGLVPLAISGVDIDFFVKGVVSARRHEFRIPPDDHWAGAYEWVVERARLAQQSGAIRGIVFHQGESDTGSPQWVGKVKRVVEELRNDLNLGEVPFVAGELLYGGCCAQWHNPLIQQLPAAISNSSVVSANGLAGIDAAHFDLPGQRELGARYGSAMLELMARAPNARP